MSSFEERIFNLQERRMDVELGLVPCSPDDIRKARQAQLPQLHGCQEQRDNPWEGLNPNCCRDILAWGLGFSNPDVSTSYRCCTGCGPVPPGATTSHAAVQRQLLSHTRLCSTNFGCAPWGKAESHARSNPNIRPYPPKAARWGPRDVCP